MSIFHRILTVLAGGGMGGYTPLVDRWQLEDPGLTDLWQIEGSTDLWDLEGSTDEWLLEEGAGTHLWLLEDTDPSTPEYWLLE